MNGCRCHLTYATAAHADPANPDAGVQAMWECQEEVLIGLLALYTTSEVYMQISSDTVFATVHDKYQHLETLYGQVGSMATFNAWVSDTLSLPYTQGTDLSVQVMGRIKLSLLLSCRPPQVTILCVGGHQTW